MKNLNVFFWALITTLTIFSCAKEQEISYLSTSNLIQTSDLSSIQFEDPAEGIAACYDFVFPIQVKVGSETQTANNIDELNRLLAKKPTSNVRSVIIFPITVIINSTQEKRVINSQEEYSALQKECAKNGRNPNGGGPIVNRLSCFKYVFPLTVSLADGTTKEVSNQDELNAIIRVSKGRGEVKLTFPFKVMKEDGTELTISNRQELARLEASCRKARNGN